MFGLYFIIDHVLNDIEKNFSRKVNDFNSTDEREASEEPHGASYG